MNKQLKLLGLTTVMLLLVTPASAQKVLNISSWAPPTHLTNSQVWPTWGKWIEEATEGRVTTKIEYKLASPLKQFELVRDGVADAAWIFHGYNTRYAATQAVEMPNLGTSAEAASVAYWRVHQKYLAKANEHEGVTLVGLSSHGPAVIQTKTPLNSLSELNGLKIRVPGGVGSKVGKALGVTAVKLPAPKVYEALSSGVADGIFMPIETQKSFRLKEVVPYVTIMPGGLYYGSFAYLLNTDFLNSLSEKDRNAILSVSGEKLTRLAGQAWDNADKAGHADALASGSTVTTASQATHAEYLDLMAPVEAAWIEQMNGLGIDGKAALGELRDIARSSP
ncbi:MAG: TRAP transporter substrate-binding protein [Arenicellales bacterium]|jgi:TRAP-type C4-dicarboxylate transport system substrate-binding protein|nr:C4-dicarboxylate ABC transporter substrate-binding protein [Acidiferrobacteraceae bacterium]MDP6137013.1 TRAP transporter substrate-binding protein [Arenicellales bacterium]MDP6392498.1 TRAP transporter substrate-binding protein [Arenicellales bacterium]MDP7220199.1 TRAP transporter substrate-binding protein [Arenicellales bacterium]HJP11807.1 TRAP transporter substrate-binding protein [Arenicellales bacterium]|tara:strand:- start:2531 stop:3538 length:1008 start_codon:yes stop_codon:yes gene_type:complete